ncbi:MAG TPA: hypothetical protein VE959_38220 [Bryobacteraceae bacterium]|nr:hypothetical protein [Bryobacteraceae bacterium]
MRIPNCAIAMAAILGWGACRASASEADALAISAAIQARHMPFGTIMDPVYASPTSAQITGYTRCGDSALWTGAYLAAEAFRYKVTQSADALNNVKSALSGIQALSDITGDNRLARCMVLASSPYAAGIQNEETPNTIHSNPPWFWVDNTSRDEVVGVFFGLGAAYDIVDDAGVKSTISDVATRVLGFIAHHQWSPNDDISNTFEVRPEELQMLLQVARHINPSNGISGPFFVPPVSVGVEVDVQSNSSYFKFNLDYMTFYNLLRIQNNGDNQGAYKTLRDHTASHQNAFFDLVDRALQGANAARDAETDTLLDQWLQRPKRDPYVDVSKIVQVCGSEACQPVPVPLRPTTDFLWQRDPFQLAGGGGGTIEGAGIDYILPYWMGRYYGVILGNTVQSAAAPGTAVAPDSLASLLGASLASATAQAGGQPPPATLGGVTLSVTDSAGAARTAPLLYVSPGQVNFVVPDGTAAGPATFTVTNGSATQTATAMVQPVAPGLFSMNGTGSGVAAATAISVQASNPQLQAPVAVFQCTGSVCVSVPINLGVDTPIYVTFYGTGIRNRSSLANVSVTINGMSVPVLYAGPSPAWDGLDQVNAGLVLGLRGSGESNVVLTVDGQASNAVTINIQ